MATFEFSRFVRKMTSRSTDHSNYSRHSNSLVLFKFRGFVQTSVVIPIRNTRLLLL